MYKQKTKLNLDRDALDKFRELYRKGIGTDDDQVVLRELIKVINDDALFADEFTQLRQFTDPDPMALMKYCTLKIFLAILLMKKLSLIVINDDGWVESFAQGLMSDFSMDENAEIDRVKELAGVQTDEETYDGDDLPMLMVSYGLMRTILLDEAEYLSS